MDLGDIPLLFDRVFGVKIREPHLYFFKAGTPIQYHAIATGDNIEYLRNPLNGSKYSNEDSTFGHQDQNQDNDSGGNGSDNNSSGTTNQQTGSLTSGASGSSDIVGGNSNSNSGSVSSSGDSGSSSSTKERPSRPPRREYDYN
ncbi:predicted protein [Naegleria gruberi]|uniref:Predicted protein n=1 Tax=Naegleria gruberi TaxID=5762 RepID=D2VEJ2_NAEGR|nr:uncharacterized protein NAEGRDRAFT_67297 [Naegleria gruberi]EFC44890.1 predicted protein [Naegleria gruberi]|eukprot:XP_002677634.1 predicted protein [Naegleria gruberi strain NEG-M]